MGTDHVFPEQALAQERGRFIFDLSERPLGAPHGKLNQGEASGAQAQSHQTPETTKACISASLRFVWCAPGAEPMIK